MKSVVPICIHRAQTDRLGHVDEFIESAYMLNQITPPSITYPQALVHIVAKYHLQTISINDLILISYPSPDSFSMQDTHE